MFSLVENESSTRLVDPFDPMITEKNKALFHPKDCDGFNSTDVIMIVMFHPD